MVLAAWETPATPATAALEALQRLMDAAGIDVHGCFRIIEGTAYDISPDAVPCCAAGHEMPTPPAPAALGVDSTPLASRQARIDSVQATPDAAAVIAAAPVPAPSTAQALDIWATLLGAGARQHIPVADVPAADLATAAAAAQNLALRDAIITWISPAAPLAPEVFGDLWSDIISRLGQTTPAGGTVIPRLIATCRRLPDDALALNALLVCAGAFYELGDGVLARAVLGRALGIDPANRLADLYLRMLDLGLRPNGEPI